MPKNYSQTGDVPEWSELVEIDKLSIEPKTFHIEASEEECENLSRRLGIERLEDLRADITLQHVKGGMIQALGTVRAKVIQNCVVSLAPVETEVEEQFEGWFGDENTAVSFARAKSDREAKKANMEVEILEESVDPEPIVSGRVDIGELTTQHLSLAIDPYPHAPGVKYELGVDTKDENAPGASLRKSPFEALKDWKEKR
jgi:hypothetical protein